MHNPRFSLEVFPPRRTGPVTTIYDTLDGLEGLSPDFISVTYGHGSQADRSATARIAATVAGEYHIPVVAHLTSLYADESSVEETLRAFDRAGVKSVLALRGDPVDGLEPTGVFPHASDLAAYIHGLRPDMILMGACYPECHADCASLEEDVSNLAIKVESGVSRLITQLFYDNDDFYHFMDVCRAHGIDVPVHAGIMPIISEKSVRGMARRGGSHIPARVEALLRKWGDDPDSLRSAGIVYASEQIADLVANGVDGVHLYTMNRPATTRRIWRNVSSLFSVE
ncbi:methylenetetrahydrofolate reductase [uncultured Bifidobacterium sp.]|uniref:methylenetetrahydrofolate reductase n=1 Tax=uncultured Bifidobacterium sp. TaxID=165187 RepID=UPI00260EC202|nr:methylenetetrahydrofolate reductase [uncultured Bifidobacterium sp.]